MTRKDYSKAIAQLKAKPAKLAKYLKHNARKIRPTGSLLKRCSRCGRFGGHISSYGLGLCRCCFREIAASIGFRKYH